MTHFGGAGVSSVLCLRLTDVQVLSFRRYNAVAAGQDVRTSVLPSLLGTIFGSTREPLASSEFHSTIITDPTKSQIQSKEASTLARVLHLPVHVLGAELHCGSVPDTSL